ncbi:MAG: hypothetical protein WCY98_09990 [Castellaniella sp.]
MTATARLDLRMAARDKEKIMLAAHSRGVPVATFVRMAALHAADAVMHETGAAAPSPPLKADAGTLADRLRGRASTRMSTDEIMQLMRDA